MSEIEALLRLAENPVVQALVMSLFGMSGAYRKYQQTGQIKLQEFPLRAFRQLVYVFRGAYFTKEKPRKLAQVDLSVEEARDRLIDEYGFEDGWYLSYDVRGEDANLRRPEGQREDKNRQLHVRLWNDGEGGCEVMAHEEYSPLQHPKLHIQNVELEPADERVVALLSD